LQGLFSQVPGISQLNIQFPNLTSWNVSSGQLQDLIAKLQQEAQVVRFGGSKLPDLSFSSLANADGNGGQLSIASLKNGDFKTQMDNMLYQLRYDEMNLSRSLPDWLKRALLAVYDTIYDCMQYLGNMLAAFVTSHAR
jgi:hypothetical protein